MPGLLTMFRRPRRLVYVFFLLFVLAWMLFKSDTCNRTANTVTKSGRQSNGIFEVKARRNWEKINLRHKLQTTRTKNEIKPETKKSQYWHFVLDDGEKRHRKFGPTIPVIYAITPTYSRLEQKAELTRLSQTFLHLSHFHWILVEDSENKTSLVINLLRSSGLSYTHLHALTPPNVKLKPTDAPYSKPRGVSQRNAGLSWIRDNLDPETQSGVVYFADDDNTYDLQVFDEMRVTQKVAVWPVGFTGHLKYGGPVVTHGKVTGWLTGLELHRPFAIDMAGFAINIKLFFQYPEAQFSNYKVRSGFQESHILQRLHISLNDLEPLADNCTKKWGIKGWHSKATRIIAVAAEYHWGRNAETDTLVMGTCRHIFVDPILTLRYRNARLHGRDNGYFDAGMAFSSLTNQHFTSGTPTDLYGYGVAVVNVVTLIVLCRLIINWAAEV